jgi:uncharacterized protein YkwD
VTHALLRPRWWTGPALLAIAIWFAAPAHAPRAIAQTVNCDVADADRPLDESETALLDLINSYRTELGLSTLAPTPTLQQAARWKAAAMAAAGPPLDHDDPDRTWEQRFLDCGYPADAAFAENLGAGDAPPDQIMQFWKESPTHDTNMRDPRWGYIGVARTVQEDEVSYWTVTFGTAPR